MIEKEDQRPQIETIPKNIISSPAEEFQNKTLRPILKMKNELLIKFFKNYLKEKKINWAIKKNEQKKNTIYNELARNQNFKIGIIHLIVGNFSTDEYLEYLKKSKEYNKRIWNMTQERILSQVI